MIPQSVRKYAKENIASSIAMFVGAVTLIGSMFGGFFFFDERYAHASNVSEYKEQVSKELGEVQQKANDIRDMMMIQMQTRKTILDMKKNQGKITPEEQVELDTLNSFLQNRHN